METLHSLIHMYSKVVLFENTLFLNADIEWYTVYAQRTQFHLKHIGTTRFLQTNKWNMYID